MPITPSVPKNFLRGKQFHLDLLKVPDAWGFLKDKFGPEFEFGDAAIIIGINDSGIESTDEGNNIGKSKYHHDFLGFVKKSNSLFPKIKNFYDFEGSPDLTFAPQADQEPHQNKILSLSDVDPEHGYGTGSAVGSLANVSSLVKGIDEGVVGIAPNCPLLICKTALPLEISETDVLQFIYMAGFKPEGSLIAVDPTDAADIISVSYPLGTKEELVKKHIDFLASFGRKGRGILFFVSLGNGGKSLTDFPIISDIGHNRQKALLISKKFFGIGSLTKLDTTADFFKVIYTNRPYYKTIYSNYANGDFEGLEFCIPDNVAADTYENIKNTLPLIDQPFFTERKYTYGVTNLQHYPGNVLPLVAAPNEAGEAIGDVNGFFCSRLTADVSQGNTRLYLSNVQGLQTDQLITIGSLKDYNDDLVSREFFVSEDSIIAGTGPNYIDINPGIINQTGYKNGNTITAYNLFGNPGLISKLDQAGSTNDGTLYLKHVNGFAANQKILIGIPERGNFEETTIQSVNIGSKSIDINPVLVNNYSENTFVTVQRYLTQVPVTNNNVLQLNDVSGLVNHRIVIVGNPGTPDSEIRILSTVDNLNKTISVVNASNGPNPLQLSYPIGTPVTGHRALAASVTYNTDVIKVTDARGIIEGMGIIIGLLNVPQSSATVITDPNLSPPSTFFVQAVDYSTNEIQLSRRVPYTYPIDTVIMTSFPNYQTFPGTSFSAPIGAGIAALILSANKNLSWLEVRDIIRRTCQKIDTSNTDAPWKETRDPSANTTTNPGAFPLSYSRWYGYGMPDVNAAVQAAYAYTNNERDLFIRDDENMTDNGTSVTNVSQIDSPDIWVRHTDPSTDGNNALPSGYSVSGSTKHENPLLGKDKWIYVRIKNRGTSLPSLEETEIIVSITFTNKSINGDPVHQDLFKFPETWMKETKDILPANYEETFFLTPIMGIDPAHYKSLQSSYDNTGSQHLIPPIQPNNFLTRIIPWSKEIRPSVKDVPNLRAYVKVHISPFDGLTLGSNDGIYVHENNNLSYKPINIIQVGFIK